MRPVQQCLLTGAVVFYDDDFVPSRYAIACIARFFERHPGVAGAHGLVLADGVQGPGIAPDDAVRMVEAADAAGDPQTHAILAHTHGLYGCNMAYRASMIEGVRFDENLPLYAWLEDLDFCGRVPGPLVHTDAFRGVHCGEKHGRERSGRRLGYSQVCNPVYLLRKATLPRRIALRMVLRNLLANHARLLRPEPWIDRRGRADGDLYVWDLGTLTMKARLPRTTIRPVAPPQKVAQGGTTGAKFKNVFRYPVEIRVGGESKGTVGGGESRRFDGIPVPPSGTCTDDSSCTGTQYCDYEADPPTCTARANVEAYLAGINVRVWTGETVIVEGKDSSVQVPPEEPFAVSEFVLAPVDPRARVGALKKAFSSPEDQAAIAAALKGVTGEAPLEDEAFLSPSEAGGPAEALKAVGKSPTANLTVDEHLLAFFANRRRQAEPWTPARVYDQVFPRLRERARNLGNQLSGGDQQMLAFGRALVTNPRLLILDEATEGLAPLVREEIWTCLARLRAAGQSILVVDKYVEKLIELAGHHTLIERGRVVWHGTSAELAADHGIWQRFLGI